MCAGESGTSGCGGSASSRVSSYWVNEPAQPLAVELDVCGACVRDPHPGRRGKEGDVQVAHAS